MNMWTKIETIQNGYENMHESPAQNQLVQITMEFKKKKKKKT